MSVTTAETKKKQPAKTASRFAGGQPSAGTQRLTATNLKKMEIALEKAPAASQGEKRKSVWGGGPRFKEGEQDDRELLYPKYDLARPNLHAMRSVMQPNKGKRRLDDASEAMYEASTAATSAVGDSDTKGKAAKAGASIAPLPYSNFTDKQLEMMLRKQFRAMSHLLTRDVVSGTSPTSKYNVVDKAVHGPKLTSAKTESRLKAEKEWYARKRPTGATYDPDDAVQRPGIREVKFGGAEARERTPTPDMRRAINPNVDAVRKTAPDVVIPPEHEITIGEILKEYDQTKRGPGQYAPSHVLTEQRQDKGVVPIKEAYYEKGDDDYAEGQVDLYPNYNITKPNKLVFKYYQPAEVGPRHAPEAVVRPGRWVYYDVDLDAVRAELARDVYFGAKEESKAAFKEREEFQQMLEAHIKRRSNRRPEHGDYEPDRKEEVKGMVDLDRMVGRFEEAAPEDVDELEGDVLILDPDKLQKRLPNIKFDLQLGRPDPAQADDDYDEQLVLEPDIDVIRKRQPTAPDFAKQLGRESPKRLDDDEQYIVDFPDDPIPKDPMLPKVVAHNFGLGKERFNIEEEKLADDFDFGEDKLDLDPQLPERRVKGFVDMDRGAERFKEKLNADPFYDEQPLNELDNDVDKALAAVRPKVNVPSFDRYTNGDKGKDIKAVKEEEAVKDEKKTANLAKSKSAYQVKNNFAGNAKAKKKVKVTTKNKPKEFANAEDEVNSYLKEFGFDAI